ncbi:UNVERIFIED_CONTAM: hypothetical protein FKN15_023435 [Acipenser sinensis]
MRVLSGLEKYDSASLSVCSHYCECTIKSKERILQRKEKAINFRKPGTMQCCSKDEMMICSVINILLHKTWDTSEEPCLACGSIEIEIAHAGQTWLHR